MRRPRIFPHFRVTPPGITARLTRPVPWRPMTDEEWEQIMHFMIYVHPEGPGRSTIMGARRSLDACFHAACMDGPWRELPAHYGRPDTIARMFRRWTHKGLWKKMLSFVAKERRGLEAIQYWVCRAFRRAWRLQGLDGITFARRLGLDSALRAASWLLPDNQLSFYMRKILVPRLTAENWLRRPLAEQQGHVAILKRLHDLCRGRVTLPRHLQLSFQERHCPELFDASPWQRPALAI